MGIGRAYLERGCDFEEIHQYDLAFLYYFRSALYGVSEAQVNLANLYDAGKGCKKNKRKAAFWYTRALKLGCSEAAYNLAVHYKINRNFKLAQYWFRQAEKMR